MNESILHISVYIWIQQTTSVSTLSLLCIARLSARFSYPSQTVINVLCWCVCIVCCVCLASRKSNNPSCNLTCVIVFMHNAITTQFLFFDFHFSTIAFCRHHARLFGIGLGLNLYSTNFQCASFDVFASVWYLCFFFLSLYVIDYERNGMCASSFRDFILFRKLSKVLLFEIFLHLQTKSIKSFDHRLKNLNYMNWQQ